MKQTATAVLKQRKPSRLVAIISAAVLMVAIIASILLGILIPKSSVVDATDSPIKSIAAIEEDAYIATKDGKISRVDHNGRVKASLDLVAFGKEKGIEDVGEAVTVQTQPYSNLAKDLATKNIWASTSHNYLFKIQETEDGELQVLDYLELKDNVMGMVEKNGYLYLLERVSLFGCLKKFDLSKPLSEGLISMGHLYLPENNGKSITLTPAKNLGILSFEIMEREVDGEMVEFAYIVHTGGLLRIATDCSQNAWKVQYDAKYPAEYEAQYAAQYETEYNKAYNNAVKAKQNKDQISEEKAKEYVNANLASVETTAKNAVEELANQAVVKELGLTSYNHSTGEIQVPYDKFDYQLMDNHPADQVSYRGAGYSVAEDKYYIVTNGFNIITCDAKQQLWFGDPTQFAPIGLETFKHTETNIVLPQRPEVDGSAMYYNKDLNVGYVLYADDNNVSCIDFNTMQIRFTELMGWNIKSLVQAESSEYLYYLTVNNEWDETDKTVLYSYKLGNSWKDLIENLTKAPF